jgi:hypothetical protein
VASQQSARERLQEQLLAQRLNVEVEQAEQEHARQQAEKSKVAGDKSKWMYWKREEAMHKEQERTWQSKLALSEDQLRVHESATSNLQHALILKDGRTELDATMTAMETLDVQENIDAMQDHAQVVSEHDKLFGERLFQPSVEQMETELNLDDEWDKEQAQSVADRLPTASTGATVSTQAAVPKSDPSLLVGEK